MRCGVTTALPSAFDVEYEDREELEQRLVTSYEAYVALKSAYRQGSRTRELYTALHQEMALQRYLHALLGHKGEPPGLLY